MELNKNYPWLSHLDVSEQLIQDWQNKNTSKSFTFWALRNRKVNQTSYFDWAVDHYQMPFLKGLFFEQNLMSKTQWNEIKDLFDWTEEILPVAFWNDTIFIGCVEPPKKEIKILDMETRYVLTNHQSLATMWKFVQSLSHFIEKENTKSIALDELNRKLEALDSQATKKPLDKPVNIESLGVKSSLSPAMPTEKPLDKPVNVNPEMSKQSVGPISSIKKPLDKPVNVNPEMSKQSVGPISSIKKPLDKPVNVNPEMSKQSVGPISSIKKPLDKPVNVNPEMSKQSVGPISSIKKPLDKPVNVNPEMSKQSVGPISSIKKPLDKPVNIESLGVKSSLSPAIPTEKPLDKPVNVNPEMSKQSVGPISSIKKPLDKPVNIESKINLQGDSFPEAEEERIIEENQDFPVRSPNEDNVLLMKDFKIKEKENISDDYTENTKFTFVDKSEKTLTHISVSCNYEELWKYTKSFYNTSMVLNVKEDKVYPISWIGRIKYNQKDDTFVDLNDYSLFKIVKKGHSYNGFVVDNPVNKKFFSQIGWEEYPKHVTAIPIKDNQNNLINVFMGFSINPMSRVQTQQIEESVLSFFEKNLKLSNVA